MHSPVITANHRGMRSDDQSIFKTSEQESNEGKEKITYDQGRKAEKFTEQEKRRKEAMERESIRRKQELKKRRKKIGIIQRKGGRNRINLSSMDKYKASREKNL